MILGYVTCKNSREGKKIARALVKARLAACVNIVPCVESVFEWEGKIREENESLLLFKTTRECMKNAEALVKKMHSYDVPCIVFYESVGGSAEFAGWVASSCRKRV